ncbi:unnamed protein product [Phaedon cochleariae]|uniref:PHD-type domain-containing protein n=1 Tax=Phaedon cochleariae TaxID=80249 RepID=A0A9N9X6W2_PHACE|nr:unnamed protein product [Phaedon cochleariae]
MTIHTCPACLRSIQSKDSGKLICSVCDGHWHGVCAAPQPADLQPTTIQSWACQKCVASKKAEASAPADIESARFKAIMDQFAVLNNTLTAKIDTLSALVESQNETIKECVNDIACLRSDNEKLKIKISTIENRISAVSQPEELQYEILERVKRQKNVIAIGLTETSNDDFEAKRLINHIIADADKSVVSTYRLGKQTTNGKPRLLRITFDSNEHALMILKNAKSMPKNDFLGVYLKSDNTPAQSKYLADLKKDLQFRTQNGEKNLTIKYRNNVPRIVPLPTSKRTRDEESSPRSSTKRKQSKQDELLNGERREPTE